MVITVFMIYDVVDIIEVDKTVVVYIGEGGGGHFYSAAINNNNLYLRNYQFY